MVVEVIVVVVVVVIVVVVVVVVVMVVVVVEVVDVIGAGHISALLIPTSLALEMSTVESKKTIIVNESIKY